MQRVTLFTLFSFIFFFSLSASAQDLDQVNAMKNVGPGLYNFWRISNGDICHQDGEVTVAIEYNEDGGATSVSLGNNKYYPSTINVLGVKKETGLYFEKSDRMVMIYYNDRLFIYERKSDDTFYTARAMVGGRKEGKYMRDFEALQAHNLELIEKEKELKADLTAKMQFTDPDRFYKKVYAESEGFRKVKNNEGKIGFINAKNEVVIEPQYDEAFNAVINGIVGVEKDGKQGYIDMQNKVVIKINNDEVSPIKAGLIRAKNGDSYQLYFPSGKRIDSDFDLVRLEESIDKFYVRKGLDHGHVGSDGVIDWFLKGKDYEDVIVSGTNYFVIKNGKQGILAADYKEVLPPVYDQLGLVKDQTYALVKGDVAGYYTVGKGFITELIYDLANTKGETKFGFGSGQIDDDGNITWSNKTKTKGVILQEPTAAWRKNYTTSGVLRIGELTQVEKNGKQGFVNDQTELVIPAIYDGIDGTYQYGLVGVHINYKYGYINELGEVIVPLQYDRLGMLRSDKLTVYENKEKLLFNLDGTPIEIVPEVASTENVAETVTQPVQKAPDYGNQKGISFYGYDQYGLNEAFAFKTNNNTAISGFSTRDGNVVTLNVDYNEDEPRTKIKSYDPGKFTPYFINAASGDAAGCETENNEFVTVVMDEYYYFKISNQKLVKVSQFKPTRTKGSCLQIFHAGNGNVIGVWANEENYFIELYNYKTNKTATFDCGIKYGRISLDVSIDQTFAEVSLMNKDDSGNMRLIGFDLKNGINGKNLVPKFDVKHKKHHSTSVISSIISMDNEVIVLYQSSISYVNSYVTLFMNKYDNEGKLLKSVMLPGLQSNKWTRTDGTALNIYGQFNYFIFNLRENINLVKNPRTGHVYISARLGAGGMYFSYGPDARHKQSGKAASDVPFLVSMDEKTLEYDGFDFIASMIDGELNDAYGERSELGSLHLKKPIIASTPEKTYLVYPENTSNKSTLFWQANFQRTGKGGIESAVARNNSNSNSSNNTSNEDNSSASNNDSNNEVKQDQGPTFKGSVTLKNDTDDQVYCWISTGGSGWISKGGSKTYSCQKGAKVYFSNSNSSSSKEFAFETSTDQCGKTIKISSVR